MKEGRVDMAAEFSSNLKEYTEQRYESTLPLLGSRREKVEGYINQLEEAEKLLMRFLYATMPLADAANYSPELFHSYVRHGLKLYRTSTHTRQLPEDIFLNYVLCYRVNNENIVDCRPRFYETLQPLVESRNTEEAVKEINYWCASEVSYAASDERTLDPLSVLSSGTGRCGEESTFLVSALRSVGIASRQVYTPRWAHCDDNHAWVEVWMNGVWHFLGACEPEEVLNRGWFTNAASRTMMIHTRVFSDYGMEQRGEEITQRQGAAVFLNHTDHYAGTGGIKAAVRDEEGNSLSGVRVEFLLLNSACFSPVAVLYTDQRGEVEITMGLGTILIQASGKGCLSRRLVDTRIERSITLVLSPKEWKRLLQEEKSWLFREHTAPEEYLPNPVKPTKEQKRIGSLRREEAETLRQRKLAKYREKIKGIRTFDLERIPGILEMAYGNAGEIADFLQEFPGEDGVRFLEVLTVKDYRDIKAATLKSHFESVRKRKQKILDSLPENTEDREEIFFRYIANPRIEYESITDFRPFLEKSLSEEQKRLFRRDPREIEKWIRTTFVREEDRNYEPIVFSPIGMFETGHSDFRSEKILFVAVCRTLGIAAKVDPVTRQACFLAESGFVTVFNEGENGVRLCRLTIVSRQPEAYGLRWTLSGLKGYGENGELEFWPMEYSNLHFDKGEVKLFLKEGIYQLTTVTRLPSGNQLEMSRLLDTADFPKSEDRQREEAVELVFAKPELSQMLEAFPLEDFSLRNEGGEEKSLSELLRCEPALLIFLETGEEPTEHVLNELTDRKEDVLASGLRVLFVVKEAKDLIQPAVTKVMESISPAVCYDSFQELPEQLARRMYTDPEKLPLLLLIDPDLTGRYACSGYNVGSVDMVLRIATLLKEESEEGGRKKECGLQ